MSRDKEFGCPYAVTQQTKWLLYTNSGEDEQSDGAVI